MGHFGDVFNAAHLKCLKCLSLREWPDCGAVNALEVFNVAHRQEQE